jgi:hypothetical protein
MAFHRLSNSCSAPETRRPAPPPCINHHHAKDENPAGGSSITCFDCDTPFSDGPNLKMVMVNAIQAGWGMEQRRAVVTDVRGRTSRTRQRFHDLRQCAATMMLVQGVPMRVVMEILGHSQISLTMNTYSHVVPALQQDAADRMDALLVGGAAREHR